MVQLSGSELSLSLIIAITGLIRNLKLFFDGAEKKKQNKWSFFIYGAAAIVLICGLLTPPDLFTNLIFSIPLITVYRLLIKRIGIKNLKLNPHSRRNPFA